MSTDTMARKVVTIGDNNVGKTTLLISNRTDHFPELIPGIMGNYVWSGDIDGQHASISVLETAGGEDYDRLRPLCYPETNVFLICFCVEYRSSFENIEAKWIPELQYWCPEVPKILVACKIDLRAVNPDAVTYHEGAALAKKHAMKYCETSSLKQIGLKACFNEAFRSAVNAPKPPKKKGLFGKVIPPPPLMPPKEIAPKIEIETSTFGDDWYSMLQNCKHCDVTFILEGKHHLDAHTIVLCSASKVFAKVFGVSAPITNNQMKEINDIENYTHKQLNSGSIPGIAAVYMKDTGDQGQTEGHTQDQTEGHTQGHTQGQHICVELSADISEKTFVRVLEFLYSGVPRFTDVEKITEGELTALDKAAEMFQLAELQTICSNLQADQAILNHSIGTYVNEQTAAQIKKLFFNQETRADVVFTVEGKTVYGHKCILSARCEVMAAMFGGYFAEGTNNTVSEINIPNKSSDAFLAVLEYMYTDRCPLEDTDAVGIIILSDEYGLKRLLNLCELYISNEVEKNFTEKIDKSEIDVIGLLLTSQNFNATQLANWCLFFISSNYIAFEQRKEFPQLSGDNKRHVEENRWPSVAYLTEVEVYNKKYGHKRDKKQCTVM